ncbi:MAG: glycosyltransferase family 4 protein [Pirellulales bacterium]|nr:glycosyltransferase family 4 protein [Pirellulales bacterium]
MPRLCLLTQYFPPEMGAPQARLSELGERLIDLGWEVEALTALPNYPTGKIFPGYSAWQTKVEMVGRIRTARVPLFPARRGFLARLMSYFSFVASAAWMGPSLVTKPDVLLAESPPLFIGYTARWLCWRWGAKFVFNVSDLYPETAVRIGMMKRGLAIRMAERLEDALYRRADGVTGQSEEIIGEVLKHAPEKPTAVITNGVDLARFGRDKSDAASRELLGPEPGPVFVYAGLMGWAQGLHQILNLADALPADVPGRFVLVGDGPARDGLQSRLKNRPNPRVRLLPALPYDRIPPLLATADAAVICLGMRIPGAVPSKIYEAMASSLPILLIAEGESARRVEAAGAGLTVEPENTAAAVAAYRRLAEDAQLREQLGTHGREAAATTYDRRQIAQRFDRFLRNLLEQRAQ